MSYDGPVIDCDIHHSWATEDEVLAYLPRRWREFMTGAHDQALALAPPIMSYPHTYGVNKRLDAFPENGRPAGTDYDTLVRQLLDPLHVERAILSFDVGLQAGFQNPYLAAEVVRAVNNWSIEHWLESDDPRLYGALLTLTSWPEEAAREIRRVGRHPKIAEVLLVLNGLEKPFGHPAYHEIYAAAADVGLPIAIHTGGDLVNWGGSQLVGGGIPNSRLEYYALTAQSPSQWLSSFITHGVFEEFADLKLLVIETGVTWVPWLLWNLDARYELLREENPALRSKPSDYFRDRVFLSTQPFEVTPDPKDLVELLEAVEGLEDVLCFASDYPHWDNDDPMYIARRLPPSWAPKVFYANGARLYGRPCAARGIATGGAAGGKGR